MARKKNRVKKLQVKKAIYPHTGLAEIEGQYFGIKGTIPGDEVLAKPGRRRPHHREAKLIDVVRSSPLRKEIGCVHQKLCGGCAYQDLEDETELDLKKTQIQELFLLEDIDLGEWEMKPSPSTEAYRNKMEYTFGDEYKDGPMALGLHVKGRFHDIISTTYCRIVPEDMNVIRDEVLQFAAHSGETYFHRKEHVGLWRHLGLRRSETTGEILVNIVTTDGDWDRETFVKRLLALNLEGKIKGIMHTTNNGIGDAIVPEKVEMIYGDDVIEETLMNLKFRLSTYAFFQTNTKGAEVVYGEVQRMVGKARHKLILDLYSGTGTMSQMMSPVADKVIGIEIVEAAVYRARESVKLNGIENVEFICGDVKKALKELNERPELIIVDPPREGIHPKGVETIIDYGPETLILVSCNPKTLAKNLKSFLAANYEIVETVGVNQFPNTAHAEMIMQLKRIE